MKGRSAIHLSMAEDLTGTIRLFSAESGKRKGCQSGASGILENTRESRRIRST